MNGSTALYEASLSCGVTGFFCLHRSEGVPVRPLCPSPLENLAAFAIAFFTGALSVLSLSRYLRRIRQGSPDVER